MNKILIGNCIEKMKELPDNSIDLILTSPPYEDISGAGYSANNKDILFFKLYSEFLDNFFNECYRVLKINGQIFFNVKSKTHNKKLRTTHWIEFTEGFQKFDFKSYIIWKYSGSFDSTKSRFHLDYEIIYHLSKGDNIYLNQNSGIHDGLSSVWYIPHNIPKKDRIHPTQMPIGLSNRVILMASKEGDIVLDPFMGSGTTIISCEKLNRKWIGIELNKEYVKIAEARIKQERLLE